jgi:hypothetical protein
MNGGGAQANLRDFFWSFLLMPFSGMPKISAGQFLFTGASSQVPPIDSGIYSRRRKANPAAEPGNTILEATSHPPRVANFPFSIQLVH